MQINLKGSSPVTYQTYGRRRGRHWGQEEENLLAHPLCHVDQEALQKDPLHRIFTPESHLTQLWLEIGFGHGEHLCGMAQKHPDWAFIGSEVFLSGIAACARHLLNANIRNVRLTSMDGRSILDHLPSSCLNGVSLLFPDPWPKKRHEKRQVFTTSFMHRLRRVLKPGGLFRFASDASAYVQKIKLIIDQFADDFTIINQWHSSTGRPEMDDWSPSRYEKKALESGRPCFYWHLVTLKPF